MKAGGFAVPIRNKIAGIVSPRREPEGSLLGLVFFYLVTTILLEAVLPSSEFITTR